MPPDQWGLERQSMSQTHIHLLLADDDKDDCLLFKEALEELPVSAELTMVDNGEELMRRLSKKAGELPSVIFLDLNMPRKNGFECLAEIKQSEKLKNLPVVIFSTSLDPEVVNMLYTRGAQYYIRKPSEFSRLKEVIDTAITLTLNTGGSPTEKEKFII